MCHFLKASDLQRLVAACPRLQSLSTSRWADGSHLRALQPLGSSLAELDLGDSATDVSSITDKALAHLPALPALRSISLKRCIAVTDAGIAHLGATRLPSLTALDLSSTRVSGVSGFDGLKLRSLILRGSRAFGDAGLAAVCGRHADHLRTLQLCGTAVQPSGISLWHLAQATGLELLDLGQSWEVDTEGMAAISCCRSLAELRLGNFNLRPPPQQAPEPGVDGVGGEAVWGEAPDAAAAAASSRAVWSLPSLTRLCLGGMFCQHGLGLLLPGLPQLKRLELAGLSTARDEVLSLLTGGGGGAAAALQELRLTSGGPDLTQAGLLSLAALPALRRLTLVACPCATDTTAQQLVEVVRAAGRRLRVEVLGGKTAASVAAAAGGEWGLAEDEATAA